MNFPVVFGKPESCGGSNQENHCKTLQHRTSSDDPVSAWSIGTSRKGVKLACLEPNEGQCLNGRGSGRYKKTPFRDDPGMISSKPTYGPESSSEYRSMDPIAGIAFLCCTSNVTML